MIDQSELTFDSFFNGRIGVTQSLNGYRFSIDAILLANTIMPKSGNLILDLGTGCGIIPLVLAHRHPNVLIQGIEVQKELYQLALMNIEANGLQERVKVILKDAKSLTVGDLNSPVDWIVSNPPYRKMRSGRINPTDQKALARHEISFDLNALVQAAKRWLKTKGRLAFIFPAERITDALTLMRQTAIEPKWMQGIHSYEDEPARLVIIHGMKAGRPGLTVAKPMIIYRHDGEYTPAVLQMMEP